MTDDDYSGRDADSMTDHGHGSGNLDSLTDDPQGGVVRAAYEEYDLEGTRVAMLTDPVNEHAWIQSDLTVAVEQ